MYYGTKNLMYTDIFNSDNINIFTDGSILTTPNRTIGCTGAIVTYLNEYGTEIISDTYTDLIIDTTNNDTEIRSILLGVSILKHRYQNLLNNIHTINIFSDSKICILGLREWVYKWITGMHNGILYNSSGDPVKNQDTFIEIINELISLNKKINLFHQKGHVNNTNNSLENARKVFFESNNYIIDPTLLSTISLYNKSIDLITKSDLKNNKEALIKEKFKTRPFVFNPEKTDFNKYIKLNISKGVNQ